MADLATTDIAITGMSCRFPGARSVAEFRDMLCQGKIAFRSLSTDEVVASGVPLSVASNPAFVKIAAPLEGIDEFDVDTFGLTPSEATTMDPQHYHFLECTYEALHMASCLSHVRSRRVGIFAGADQSYYATKRVSEESLWDPMGHWQDLMGNDSHFMATAVSYRLGLTGPSVGIQTACSTSLVAVHMAVQALISGDCDVAVAGGVSIRGPQTRGYLHRDGSILSPTGRCRPFDKDADGTVLSSGVGTVVLMRLADAVTEGTPVWAVIKGSAINNDGDRKVGYTAPSVEGQASVISEALSVARIDPSSLEYIETHGTGTQLGDPIEYRGLLAAHKWTPSTSHFIRIGSVKSNFGHLESAAGIAALIKSVLSLHYGEVYPSLGFATPNTEIDFTNSPFRMAENYEKLPPHRNPWHVAVSSFGIGGTNCHIVLGPPPLIRNQSDDGDPLELQPFPFHRRKVWFPPFLQTAATVRPIPALPASASMVPGTILADIWCDILGKTPEPTDDFISSGGDSLKAMQIVVKIKDAIGAELSIEDILDARSFTTLVDTLVGRIPTETDVDYPLSAGQQSLWQWQLLNPQSPAYTVQAVFSLKGLMDATALQGAFEDLVTRQEALRTSFVEVNGEVRQQVIQDCSPIPWRYVENAVEQSSAWTLIAEHGRTVIDLSRPPLLSVFLVRTGETEHLLSVISHHIVSDEWSAQVMLGDVIEFYAARTHVRHARLKHLSTSMGQKAEQEQWLNSSTVDTRYWKTKLSDAPRFDLPWDRQQQGTKANEGAALPLLISKYTYAKIKRLAQTYKATPFMVLLAVFKVLCLRYTGQCDLCIGTNIAGREDQEISNIVGLFTNTVVLRTDLSGNPTFSEALRRVRRTALEAYEHQIPFPLVLDAVRPQRLTSRNPLFDVMLVLQNVPQRMMKLPNLEVTTIPFHNGTCKFDLELTLTESSDGSLVGHWEYDTNLFDGRTIEQFSQHFIQLLQSAVENPDELLSRLDLISIEERTALLEKWNQMEINLRNEDTEQTVWDIFVNQAGKNGTAPAIISSDAKVTTYAELAHEASALAERLRGVGVGPGCLVGIFCDRSPWYIRALLAVQACEAAFLPLDPTLPDSRLTDILQNSQVQYVIIQKQSCDHLDNLIKPITGYTIVKVLIDEMETEPITLLPKQNLICDLAYVIYTSGSTGMPKGAMVSRAGMLNHLQAKIHTLGLQNTTMLAFTAPLCFDISIWQCLAPLLAGGTVVVINDDEVMDLNALCDRLSRDRVNIVELVPSYLDALLAHLNYGTKTLQDLRLMVATGERLSVETCRRWFDLFPSVPILNAYGPTECADDVLQYVIREKPTSNTLAIPIGYALPNVKVYVLDEELAPVPVGAVGEIYIGGVCVGLGYLNDAKKTTSAFLPDLYSKDFGAHLYKTGDLGRRRSDGAIEYIGRIDSQVKVHGARVEIEDVEALLRQCSGVGEVAITPAGSGGSLVAIVAPPSGDTVVDVHGLREEARTRLPWFMLPSEFLAVDAIPKTASGKIDRAALVRIASQRQSLKSAFHREGSHSSETVLVKLHDIWCRVLDLESVSDDANFFELGGDSLKTIRVASLAQREGFAITPAHLVAHPILRDLAINCMGNTLVEPTHSCVSTNDSQLLTRGEQWFLDRKFADAHLHDSGFLLYLAPEVQTEAVTQAICSLWHKHEGLRTRFDMNADGIWKKTILPDVVPTPFSAVDTSGITTELVNQLILVERNRIPSHDGFLFKATLFSDSDLRRLLVVAHYLACDLVSWQILLDDFEDAISCGAALNSDVTNTSIEKAGRPIFDSCEERWELPVEETRRLLDYAKAGGFGIETVLVAATSLAVSVLYSMESISIWLGKHGRYSGDCKQDTSQTIGRLSYPVQLTINVTPNESLEQILPKAHQILICGESCSHVSTSTPTLTHLSINIDYLGNIPVSGHGSLRKIEAMQRQCSITPKAIPVLDIVSHIAAGCLSVCIRSSPNRSNGKVVSSTLFKEICRLISC